MRLFLLVACIIGFFNTSSAQAIGQKSVDHKWGKSLASYKLGQATATAVDSHNHVFIFHRASLGSTNPTTTLFIPDNTVLMLDGTSGEILKRWGADTFIKPHGLEVDSHDNVWVTDVDAHTVQKFSHDGDHLMTLGTHRVSGDDPTHFNKPADMAFAPNGDIFIADGYINTRVVKFSAQGDYLMAWGKPGTGAGEFDLVHGISVSSDNLVYVADRTNSRLQVFDTNGTFKKIIPSSVVGRPFDVEVDKSGSIFIIDGGDPGVASRSKIIMLAKDGSLTGTFDANFDQNKSVLGHGIALGADGALYVADVFAKRVIKVVKK